MTSILLVKTTSLGDVIHNLPTATDLRRHFPEARIDWLVEESYALYPSLHRGIDEVLTVALRRWRKRLFAAETWREMAAFRRRLQSRRYDYVIDTQTLFKSMLLCKLAQGPSWGYAPASARDPRAARCYDHTCPVAPGLHAVDHCRALPAAIFGYPLQELDYGLAVEALSADWLPQRPYVVLCTATSRDDKLWAEAHWLELANWLHQQGYGFVLPGGTSKERQRAARLAGQMKDAVAAPPMDLLALTRLLKGADLVVGVDTGLTHVGAALGKRTLAIFTATDPGHTGVFAGERAINIGSAGHAPSAAQACQEAQRLLLLPR